MGNHLTRHPHSIYIQNYSSFQNQIYPFDAQDTCYKHIQIYPVVVYIQCRCPLSISPPLYSFCILHLSPNIQCIYYNFCKDLWNSSYIWNIMAGSFSSISPFSLWLRLNQVEDLTFLLLYILLLGIIYILVLLTLLQTNPLNR